MAGRNGGLSGTPKVSIIINVRNGDAYLKEAIDSVLCQTFSDWELIVWDNCSTDKSAEVVRRYSDRRIRYVLSPEFTPLGPARSAAIIQAQGEWVAFIDYDDVWVPDKLALQISIADTDSDERVGMIYGRTVIFFPNGSEQDFDTHHEFQPLPEGELFEEFFRASCFVTLSSAIFRRSALEQVGNIPRDFDLIGDYYLFTAISRSYRVRAVQQVVCRYRRHSSNLSKASWQPMHEEALVLVQHCSKDLGPELARLAHRRHATAIAMRQIRHLSSCVSGISSLLRHGSVPYVLSRPLARLQRAVRRRLGRPRTVFPDEEFPSTAVRPGKAQTTEFPLMLSIVIVNWNVCDLLRDCIESVYANTRLFPQDWELIVIDNHSADGSAEMVRRQFPRVMLVENHANLGFAKANNQGFLLCRGRFIHLLNPDAVLPGPAADQMLEIMNSQPNIGALGSRLLNADHTVQHWTAGAPPGLLNVLCHFLFVYRVLPAAILPKPLFMEREPTRDAEVGWLSGASLMLRREALGAQIFDERYFMYGEDIHLCQSLKQAGWKVVYTPRVAIVHYGGRSTDSNTSEIQLNRISNLRKVFSIGRTGAALLCFDVILSFGFLLRAVGFGLASLLRPASGYDVRAEKSRRFLWASVRSLLKGS